MKIRHSKKFDIVYMQIAMTIATLSYCRRLQVGCIIVKNNSIIAEGYNGTPSGHDNCCEEGDTTKSEVLHAESNALMKIAKSNNSSDGATIYTTVAPCMECAKLFIQAGIERVVYDEEYRDMRGVELLLKSGVTVQTLGQIRMVIEKGNLVHFPLNKEGENFYEKVALVLDFKEYSLVTIQMIPKIGVSHKPIIYDEQLKNLVVLQEETQYAKMLKERVRDFQ